jgi:hypothetical protein
MGATRIRMPFIFSAASLGRRKKVGTEEPSIRIILLSDKREVQLYPLLNSALH